MNNKFFTDSDSSIDTLIYPLEPSFWWSRRFEYCWALTFIKKDMQALDCCAGLEHPFKFAITDKCKKVYACDLENLSYDNLNKATMNRFGIELDKSQYDKIEFTQCNIINLSYKEKQFDLITCISAMEHIDDETKLQGLKELKRVLKDDGKIVLTLDYPTTTPETMMELISKAGLKIHGKYDYSIPKDVIYSDYFGERLYCFSMVLKK